METPATTRKSKRKLYRKQARDAAKAYLTEKRQCKTRAERKARKAACKTKRREWKMSLSTLERPERKAQKRAYRAFKRRKNRTRRLCVWTAVLCVVALAAYAIAPIASALGGILSLQYTTGTPEIAAARANAAIVAEQIANEGIVLLKNDGAFLPLADTKVNVFGMDAHHFRYGGSGSGGADQSAAIDFFASLTNAGISYNEELYALYAGETDAGMSENGLLSIAQTMLGAESRDELPIERLTDDILSNAKAYSDQAVIVVGSAGVEAADSSLEQLRLTQNRAALIEKVAAAFSHVVVIVNAGNAMELGFLDAYDTIDAALWVGTPGPYGCVAIGNILAGRVNPSGRLSDTYAFSVSSSPASVNFGDFAYDNLPMAFLHYNEGIYVGYRYYETRYLDDEAAYRQAVQYPFGYGLSYTDFGWETVNFAADDEYISWDVKVTNIGDVAGKDVVELYFSAPYTPGGVEKSAIELAAYQKTGLLAPGESETVSLRFAVRDMSSYDMHKRQAYVLDAGTYTIKLGRSVHDIVETNRVDIAGEGVVYDTDEATGTKLENRFGYGDGGLTYLSRGDWEGTYPDNANLDRTASQALLAAAAERPAASANEASAGGAENGIVLGDLRGLPYDDARWEAFLEQFTTAELKTLFVTGGYRTAAIERLGVPAAKLLDGPAGINSLFQDLSAASYPTEVVIASTWNDALAYEMGEAIGAEAVAYGIQGWYAPGMNLHRTAQGGRNFEYFSEDPLLSGKMSAGMVGGAQSKRILVFMKHFALNNEETNARSGLYIWCNEQAIRELYLRPFEITVKEGGVTGAMSSFVHIGHKWCGGNEELLEEVLRGAWGFRGVVTTDAVLGSFMDVELAARYGNDLMLDMGITGATRSIDKAYRADPAGITAALRNRAHNICYALVNNTYLFD